MVRDNQRPIMLSSFKNVQYKLTPRALVYDVFHTPVSWIAVMASSLGICRTILGSSLIAIGQKLAFYSHTATHDPNALADVRSIIQSYLEHNKISHKNLEDVILDLSGAPPFFAAAWHACRNIPAGETRSYRWLAKAAGNPKATRAAGQAMARNPIPIIIPCHRVISSSGKLHGYGGGLDLKAQLLDLDRALINQSPL